MSELRTSAVVDLKGNLEQRARRYERSMRRMSQRGQRYMRGLGRATAAAGRGLDALGNRWTALATGAAGIGAARMVIRHEERLTRLGITAQLTQDQVRQLNDEIFRTAQASDVRVDPSQITSAIEAIVEKTGDLQFARNNIRNIGLALQATGGAGTDIGEVMAELQKMGIERPGEVLRVLDTLNVQGKQGAFTLQHLARLGPRVMTTYAGAGRSGTQALREMGAALQVIRMGTGNADQAATAFEATVRTLTDPKKIEQLRSVGIQVFDPEQLKEGVEVLRPINELMVEIVEAADGARSKVGTIFEAEAMRAFNQILGEYKRTGGIDSMQRFLEVQGDGTTTINDSARAASTASAALTNLFSAWQQFADANLAGPIQDLADAVNSIDPEQLQSILNVAKWTAIGLGGAFAVKKGVDATRWIRGGRGGAGGVMDAVTPDIPIPLPVYVVNRTGRRRMRKMGRSGGRGGRAGGNTAQASRAGRAFRATGKVALPLGLGYAAGTLLNEFALEGTSTGHVIGRTVAMIMAGFGSDAAEQALRAEAEAVGRRRAEESETRITISVEDDRVRLKGMAGPGPSRRPVDVEVDSGPAMPEGS